MARPQAPGFPAHAELRTRSRARTRRIRRLAISVFFLAFMIPIVVLVFDSGTTTAPIPIPPADRLLPAGPPTPQVVALEDTLRLNLPIAESHVTAVGYHAVAGALALEPVGTQANAGVLARLFNRFFGPDEIGIRYYLLGGDTGPETAGLDVGAPEGSDVYAPVDGTVIGVTDHILSGAPHGVRIDLQPAGSPGLVVSMTGLELDEALAVGSTVAASRTRIGSVLDLSEFESPALARYTQDHGQHLHLEVRPTADLSLP